MQSRRQHQTEEFLRMSQLIATIAGSGPVVIDLKAWASPRLGKRIPFTRVYGQREFTQTGEMILLKSPDGHIPTFFAHQVIGIHKGPYAGPVGALEGLVVEIDSNGLATFDDLVPRGHRIPGAGSE